ncbi:MAG: metal-dependent hydrolase, partial [Planctomycetota bacterium]
CSVSGMLPDLDSDSGRPLREATALASAVVPVMMLDRFERLQLDHDSMILAAGLVYLGIRFIVAEIFRRYTVHRGMWHSIPACLTVGMLAFLITECDDLNNRLFKSSAVMLGFMSHLILDELWSIDFRRGRYAFKRSFGTALKLWGPSRWANVTTYAKLALVTFLAYQDYNAMRHMELDSAPSHRTATEILQTWTDMPESWMH